MKNDEEVLKYVAENSKMGIIGINDVVNELTNKDFKDLLIREKAEYESIYNNASELLNNIDSKEKEINPLAKISIKISSQMELDKKDATQSIAKMMFDGTTKGISAIQNKLNNYEIKDKKIAELANKLKATLEHNIDDLKTFL